MSTRAEGDFHPERVEAPTLSRRHDRLTALVADRDQRSTRLEWTVLDQQHTNRIVRVAEPGQHTGTVADGAITDREGVVLSAWVGDCAPVVMIGSDHEFAVVHAGWRGLANGVVAAARDAFREPLERVVIGPVIGPCCYEFGLEDLASVARGVGTEPAAITRRTTAGSPSLDMVAAVTAAVSDVAVEQLGGCTGCSRETWFSHRVRSEPERHTVAAWQEPGHDR